MVKSLVRYRQLRADAIADGMSEPEGGIAAALLIGDRRHVDARPMTCSVFSGLAHLLAISGLHMGLLCFGIIGFVRAVMALMPHTASRFALHKYIFDRPCRGGALCRFIRCFNQREPCVLDGGTDYIGHPDRPPGTDIAQRCNRGSHFIGDKSAGSVFCRFPDVFRSDNGACHLV